jgi:hypothetical protein
MNIFLWLLNGFLAGAYLLWGKLQVVLLAVPLAWMYLKMPVLCGEFYRPELRPWLGACSIVWLVSAVISPSPVPLFLFVMETISAVVVRIEKFNPAETYWSIISGMTIYSLVGIGSAFLVWYFASVQASAQRVYFGQGQDFIGTLTGFA